jgi:hypothetical protein
MSEFGEVTQTKAKLQTHPYIFFLNDLDILNQIPLMI